MGWVHGLDLDGMDRCARLPCLFVTACKRFYSVMTLSINRLLLRVSAVVNCEVAALVEC
jgi:hypothetical protein